MQGSERVESSHEKACMIHTTILRIKTRVLSTRILISTVRVLFIITRR
jgi:hypothetical protein